MIPADEAAWWRSQLPSLPLADRAAVHDLLDRLDAYPEVQTDAPAK